MTLKQELYNALEELGVDIYLKHQDEIKDDPYLILSLDVQKEETLDQKGLQKIDVTISVCSHHLDQAIPLEQLVIQTVSSLNYTYQGSKDMISKDIVCNQTNLNFKKVI